MKAGPNNAPRDNPKAWEIAKEGTGTKTKTKGSEGSIISFMEKTKVT